MSAKACELYPKVNGKDSRMYKDLLKKQGLARPLVNWIYAAYVASNAADAMDAQGYVRNSQNEHSAKDVMKFMDINTMLNEMSSLASEERRLGAVDSNGQRVDFTDAKVALQKADDFNDNHTGLIANVYKYGDVYQIIVSEKNSRTHDRGSDAKERLQIWDLYKHVFNTVGVDIENMPQSIKNVFSAYNKGLVQDLRNLKSTNISYLSYENLMTLFSISANTPEVKRLLGAFGSLENAAQRIVDLNHRTATATSAQQRLLMNAVSKSQQVMGIDLAALEQQVNQLSQTVVSSSPEEAIKQTLKSLNQRYHIDANEIHRTTQKIKSLSEAAADAAVQLQRKINEMQNEKGNNAEGKRLEGILDQLMRELQNKKYYSGVLNFLNEANSQVAGIDAMIQGIPQTGTELEKAFGAARVLRDIDSLKDQYYALASALADEKITIDQSISQADVDNMRQVAKEVKEAFDAKSKVLRDLTEETMVKIMTEIVGDTAPNGQPITNVIKMAATDSSIMDYLYSMGRASNPIIAAMGSIIRNAQDGRDVALNDIALRIRRATDKLYKSGSNSEFMYEDDGHIISDIDWNKYVQARNSHIKHLLQQGYKAGTFDFKQAMEDWEDQNTEDRVVDTVNGRSERVPDSRYRKPFPNLTQAQQEYYDTMMQIKGEIGTLLPAYAQHQYLPPQLRRNMLDALGKAKNAHDVWKAFKNKGKDLYVVREDDTDYNTNGIIDGQEYTMVKGAYDNTPLRKIPIFFINRVEEGELLKDFSSGLQALASTAINYDVMNDVAQVVEFMGDFTKDQAAKDRQQKAEVIGNKEIKVFKDLLKWGRNNNTENLIDGFISQHVYGQKRDPNEDKWWVRAFDKIVAYTSFKGLATNVKGAFSNYLVGEFQMLIEAGAGEFYGLADYAWAHSKLFGSAGVGGELAELLTNNMNHKATLFREMFDPIQENYSDKSRSRYHTSMFRQLVSHDCSFIGYSSGEYLIHYVNMYGVLHNTKVNLNGETISLYDAFEVSNKQDGNSELVVKQGVTQLDGSAITPEFLDAIKKKIRYVNQSTHGSMNAEDKGLIHQHFWGRGVMNFRQWMVEHYSRRFRKRHFDASLGMDREGYWVSFYKGLLNDETKGTWSDGEHAKAVGMFVRDFYTFMFRAQSQWSNLDEMQRYNVKRVKAEMTMYLAMLGLSFALGEPDEHKKEFWRRWWIYQVKRLILDTEASMPNPRMVSSGLTILQSPMAGINTMNSLLYVFYGLTNGDLFDEIKSGDHQGENRYWRNIKKNVFPFYKDWEQMQKMDTDDAIFLPFKDTPTNR